jgi:hypothetical protein
MNPTIVPAAPGAHAFKLWYAPAIGGDPEEIYDTCMQIVAYRITPAERSDRMPKVEPVFFPEEPNRDTYLLYPSSDGKFVSPYDTHYDSMEEAKADVLDSFRAEYEKRQKAYARVP